ncbi:MAG TPA: hypothetical protein VEQ87_18340 [Burkholderiales bacterium]|nr:hypothetical protein [Burkholderiales bacterium]
MAIAAAAAALMVALIFTLLVVFPIPPIGRAFVLVGYPLGQAILEFAPDAFIRALAPEGGPEAVGWAIALGTFSTWFVVFFGVWYFVLWRFRSTRGM